MPSPRDIADALNDIAVLKRLAGENDFKAAAFEKAARTFEGLAAPLPADDPESALREMPGVGESIRRQVLSFLATGEMPERAALRAAIPPGLLEWLRIPGLGPKRIRKIHEELGISTLPDLLARCADGSVAALSGFGEKTAAKIITSARWLAENAERCTLDIAQSVADRFAARVRGQPGVLRLDVAGSLRRGMETVGDVDLLVAAEPGDAPVLLRAFTETEGVAEVLALGDTKASVRAREGRQVDLRVVAPAAFGAALLYFTGSKDHNVMLRGRARELGLGLNEYGLFHLDAQGETEFTRPAASGEEVDLYQALGLPFIPPELREGRGEEDWAGGLTLLRDADIRGILHAHSTWSDGSASLSEMAEACIARGYEYLGITDHSRAAAYANGLSIERVRAQWEEIDRLNAAFRQSGRVFRIFKGIESDILTDGSLDYPEEILAGFDFVIASAHSQLDMPPAEMLERMCQAAANPYTTLIGHPTGRLLTRRPGNTFDLAALIDTAARHGTGIEINANPWRLDLDWRHGAKAREAGLLTSVNPDAHEPEGIDHTAFGVRIARKAGFAPSSVLNTRTAGELAEWLGK